MDININISKTHVFAETFFKRRPSGKARAAAGSLVFHFGPPGLLIVFASGPAEHPRIKSFLRLETDFDRPDPDRAKAIADYVSSLGLRRAPHVAAVSSEGLSFRPLALPSMPDPDLRQAAVWELKKKFFVNPDEQLISMAAVREWEGPEGPEKLVHVFHAEKKSALARLTAVTALGFPLHAFWPGPEALARLAFSQSEKEDTDLLVVEIDGAQARLSAVQKGMTMLLRAVPVPGPGAAFSESAYERLAEEIVKTLEFYEAQKSAAPVSRILLAGGGYDGEAFSAYLRPRVSVKVTALDGARYVSEELSDEQRDLLVRQPGLFAEALGALALREESLNLLPEEIRAHNRGRQLDRSMRKVFLVCASAMAFWLAWTGVQWQVQASRVRFIEKEWAEIQAGQTAFSDIASKEKARRTAMKGAIDLPALLKELSRLTPSLIVSDSIRYSREEGSFKLSGIANDVGNENVKLVTQYSANLAASPFFKSVTLGQTMEEGEDRRMRFQVDGAVKPAV